MTHTNVINFLSNSHWYCDYEHLENIRGIAQSIIDGENEEIKEAFLAEHDKASHGDLYTKVSDNVAIVRMHGTIMKRANLMMAFSGGVSTEQLTATFTALQEDDSVETVILDVDSPGGSVRGVESARRALRALAEKKNVYSIANDVMGSAAYYIASAADKVYVTPSSTVGSIGVIAKLEDRSKLVEESGVELHVLRMGEYKALLNGSEPFTEKGLKEYEKRMKKYYNDFINAVSQNLNIDMAKARELADGRTYEGDQAIEAGLADEETTLADLIDSVKAAQDEDDEDALRTNVPALIQASEALGRENTLQQEQIEGLQKEVEKLQAKLDLQKEQTMRTQVSAVISDAVKCGKIAPTKKDDWIERAMGLGLETTKEILADIPENKALSNESVNEQKPQIEDEDPLAPKTEVEQEIFKLTGASKYTKN